MPMHVCSGAMLQCSFGLSPSSLVVLPTRQTNTSYAPAATITDNVPMSNIMPFGMCTSLANPSVASATSAASGVLTPMPCVPLIPGPWTAGAPTVVLGSIPALDDTSTLMCAWSGVISVVYPGQLTERIP